MLLIDDNEFNVIKEEIKLCNFTNNGVKGHNINIHIDFTLNDKKGYLNLDVGYEMDNSINVFTNREYSGIPFDHDDDAYIFFEIYDTYKFLDTEIESEVHVNIGELKENKVPIEFELNDDLIKIKYKGELEV